MLNDKEAEKLVVVIYSHHPQYQPSRIVVENFTQELNKYLNLSQALEGVHKFYAKQSQQVCQPADINQIQQNVIDSLRPSEYALSMEMLHHARGYDTEYRKFRLAPHSLEETVKHIDELVEKFGVKPEGYGSMK